jgi:hypothetical protein
LRRKDFEERKCKQKEVDEKGGERNEKRIHKDEK